MRMRELEKLSGVGRETIRFYIREGLLPEPARAARNSAWYSSAHVERLKAIKRLQEERFLPLAIIRNLLDEGAAEQWLEPQAFPDLDNLLRRRIDHDAPRVPVTVVMAAVGFTRQKIDEQVATGVIMVDANDTLSARDAAIVRVMADLERIGFTRERGFTPETMGFYRDVIEWVTTEEMRLFFEHTAGQVDEAEATDMAERGISGINELLGLMRTEAVLRKMAARRRAANDNL